KPNFTHYGKIASMEKFRGTIGEFAAQRKRDFMTSFQENILLDSNFNRPEDYDAVVTDMVRRGDYWPIILGTHKSHPAGFPLIEEAAYLQKLINPYLPPTDQIRGSLLLIANTMENGQSDDIVEGLKRVQPIFSKNNTETLPVLRKKDAKHLNEDL